MWNCRPSELLGFKSDQLEAYSLDSAVSRFGGALAAELEKVEGKTKKEIEGKQQRILAKWIPEARVQQFRDPAKG